MFRVDSKRMFRVVKNALKSVDYDVYLDYVQSIEWADHGSLSRFMTDKYITPIGQYSTRNATILEVNEMNGHHQEPELEITLSLYQVNVQCLLSYHGQVQVNQPDNRNHVCGNGVTFNEVFIENDGRMTHTFLIENAWMFSVSCNQIKFKELPIKTSH